MSWYLLGVFVAAALGVDVASGQCVNKLWKYYEGSNACYYYGPGNVTYQQAKDSCAVMGVNARLVTIHSQGEQNFLNTQYGNVKYWVGLEYSSGKWTWVDNSIFVYSNWASGTITTSKCPQANNGGSLGQWTTTTCTEKTISTKGGTLCKYYVTATTAAASGTTTTAGTTAAAVTTTPVATTTVAACVDSAAPGKASDCPNLAYLCNNAVYYELMTQECPYTCNRCPGQTATCADKLGPDGTTDCPQKSWLCNEPVYFDYMTEQCPYTCNRCPGSTTCADKLGPDGTTDCPQKSYLCENAIYYDYMTEQCPLTCNRC